MAYFARSGSIGDYLSDGWGSTLNNTNEENTNEENNDNTEEESLEEENNEEENNEEENNEEENNEEENNEEGNENNGGYDDEIRPFYRNLIDDQFSYISGAFRDTHLSASPDRSSWGPNGLDPISHDMEGHDRRADMSNPGNTSQWRESSGQFSTTEESSDSDFSHTQRDSGTSGELFPSYSTSPDSSHLVGATETTPSHLEGTASSYHTTSPPVDTFSRSLFDNPGSYEFDTHNYPSTGSTYGGSSTLGGSSTYGAYSTYQLGDSSNSAPGASSPYQFDTSVGSVDMSSSAYLSEDSSNTKNGDSSAYSYGDLSSSAYESSPSYSYGGTSDSAYGTSWGSNHPY